MSNEKIVAFFVQNAQTITKFSKSYTFVTIKFRSQMVKNGIYFGQKAEIGEGGG